MMVTLVLLHDGDVRHIKDTAIKWMKFGCVVPAFPLDLQHSQMWVGAGRTNSHVTRSVGIRSLDLPIYSPKRLGLVPFVAVVLHRLRVTNGQNVSEQVVATTREFITA